MNDRFDRIERLLGRLLSAGTLASTILLAAGLGLWMAGRAAEFGTLLLHAGFLVLMATPMARVVVSVIAYLRERDWQFALLAALVLLVLAGTVVVALSEANPNPKSQIPNPDVSHDLRTNPQPPIPNPGK